MVPGRVMALVNIYPFLHTCWWLTKYLTRATDLLNSPFGDTYSLFPFLGAIQAFGSQQGVRRDKIRSGPSFMNTRWKRGWMTKAVERGKGWNPCLSRILWNLSRHPKPHTRGSGVGVYLRSVENRSLLKTLWSSTRTASAHELARYRTGWIIHVFVDLSISVLNLIVVVELFSV